MRCILDNTLTRSFAWVILRDVILPTVLAEIVVLAAIAACAVLIWRW